MILWIYSPNFFKICIHTINKTFHQCYEILNNYKSLSKVTNEFVFIYYTYEYDKI